MQGPFPQSWVLDLICCPSQSILKQKRGVLSIDWPISLLQARYWHDHAVDRLPRTSWLSLLTCSVIFYILGGLRPAAPVQWNHIKQGVSTLSKSGLRSGNWQQIYCISSDFGCVRLPPLSMFTFSFRVIHQNTDAENTKEYIGCQNKNNSGNIHLTYTPPKWVI